jgi:hypothetical protein
MSNDYVQLEGFYGNIKDTVSVIFCDSSSSMWIPHEFINSGEITTKVFLFGEHSNATRSVIASEPWSMIMCMNGIAGQKNWSILASMCKHMVPPLLIVITPDVTVPISFLSYIGNETTMLVYRWLSDLGNIGVPAHSIFFPLQIQASQISAAQRSMWKGMPLRTSDGNLPLIVQETRPQGLCLVCSVLNGGIVTISWYRPKDSDLIVIKERQDSLAMWLSVISDRIVTLLKN